MTDLASIFDDAQRLACNKMSCANKLKSAAEKAKNKTEMIKTVFCSYFDRVLVASKADAKVNRLMDFFAESVSSFSVPLFEICVEHLLERTEVIDKVVRLRTLQILASIMTLKTAKQSEISENLCQIITCTLLKRLNDRFANVRAQTVLVLKNLQSPSDNDEVVNELMRLINSDSSHEVRATVVEGILINPKTLQSIIARVRDVHRMVRIATLKRLAENVDMRHLTVKMRTSLTTQGLNDRDEGVKNAAVDLIFAWARTFDYKVPMLLKYLGLTQNESQVETVAFGILSHIDKRSEIAAVIKDKIMNEAIEWNDTQLTNLVPAELVWTQLRCAFFTGLKLTTTNRGRAEIVSELVPDIVKACSLVPSSETLGLSSAPVTLLTVRCLLKLCPYFSAADVAGNRKLAEICRAMVLDIRTPDCILDHAMNAWRTALENLQEWDVGLYVELIEVCKEQTDLNEAAMWGSLTYDDVSAMDLKMARALRLLSWFLQQSLGVCSKNSSATVQQQHNNLVSSFETHMVPLVLDSLMRPDPELRGLAVGCLGLLMLFSETFSKHYDILLTAAGADLEDEIIRSQATKAIIDIATVHGDTFKDVKDDDGAPKDLSLALTSLLIRLIDQTTGTLQRVAVEGAAKLLFSGCLTDCRLFANLIKFFCLPELSEDANDQDNSDPEQSSSPTLEPGILLASTDHTTGEGDHINANVGSPARLHQTLSLFFTFFLVNSPGQGSRDLTLLRCVSDLVADVCLLIKSGRTKSDSLNKVYHHLMGMCKVLSKDQLPPKGSDDATVESAIIEDADAGQFESLQSRLQTYFAAAISREMLKLGRFGRDRTLSRELLRQLNALDIKTWIQPQSARAIETVLALAERSCDFTDKISAKTLVQLYNLCQQYDIDSDNDEENEFDLPVDGPFEKLAPGLVDLLGMMGDDIDASFVSCDPSGEETEEKSCTAGSMSPRVSSKNGGLFKPLRASHRVSGDVATESATRAMRLRSAPAKVNKKPNRVIYTESSDEDEDELEDIESESDEEEGSDHDDEDYKKRRNIITPNVTSVSSNKKARK